MSLPAIVPENQIRRFRYFYECSLYEGMTFRGRLYKRLRTYGYQQRLRAFEHACELSSRGDVVISTADSATYSLWVDVCLEINVEPLSKVKEPEAAA